MFNTLSYTKKLEEAGVVRVQAEVYVQTIEQIVEDNLATKEDIKDLNRDMRLGFAQFEIRFVEFKNELKNEMRTDIRDLKNELIKLEYRLLIKMGVLVTVSLTTVGTVLKILFKFF